MGSSSRLHNSKYQALLPLLKKWRIEAGMTQRDLAVKLNVPQSIICKSETGSRRLDPIEYFSWVLATDQKPSAATLAVLRQLT